MHTGVPTNTTQIQSPLSLHRLRLTTFTQNDPFDKSAYKMRARNNIYFHADKIMANSGMKEVKFSTI